ncbi:hypothetical protein HYV71_04350 [Candidatus Uhrbacteria bacterium]|nr:hypothetical protein [Candidatus Uhrbacteria bacterium]
MSQKGNIGKKRAVLFGIAVLTAIAMVGLYVLPAIQSAEAAIDCTTLPKGPRACTSDTLQGSWVLEGVASRTGKDPTTQKNVTYQFLISGCGTLVSSGGERIPCYHSVNGIIQAVITVGDLILGIVGALALLMFVWGGFLWLTSGGSEERVKAGTTTFRNSVIGLLIVFASWLGVNYIVSTLAGEKLFSKNLSAAAVWYQAKKAAGEAGALCYRALTVEELNCALTKPYVAPTPAPAAAPAGPTCDSPAVVRSGPASGSGETCVDVCRRAVSDTTITYPGGKGGDIGTLADRVEQMPDKTCCCSLKKGPLSGEDCVSGPILYCGFGLICNIPTGKCQPSASISAP